MSRFKIVLEYEGTRYSGWQVQKNARTVQGELNGAIRTVFATDDFEFMGAGRTDAGVHALQQVAHLDVSTMLAPEIIRMKLNDKLPADINILEVAKTGPRFHARTDAVARSYLYQISRRRTAFGKRFVWWIREQLEPARMKDAAELFTGLKDFRSFTADDPEEKSTKVEVESIELAEAGELILVRCVGSHFVWKMVRRMVGVLAEVGRGALTADDVHRMLIEKSDEPAAVTAPPSGLFLERVYYRGEERLRDLKPVMEIDFAHLKRSRPAREKHHT